MSRERQMVFAMPCVMERGTCTRACRGFRCNGRMLRQLTDTLHVCSRPNQGGSSCPTFPNLEGSADELRVGPSGRVYKWDDRACSPLARRQKRLERPVNFGSAGTNGSGPQHRAPPVSAHPVPRLPHWLRMALGRFAGLTADAGAGPGSRLDAQGTISEARQNFLAKRRGVQVRQHDIGCLVSGEGAVCVHEGNLRR